MDPPVPDENPHPEGAVDRFFDHDEERFVISVLYYFFHLKTIRNIYLILLNIKFIVVT